MAHISQPVSDSLKLPTSMSLVKKCRQSKKYIVKLAPEGPQIRHLWKGS